MVTSQELLLDLRSDPACLADVRNQLRGWAEAAGWSDPQIADIVLAVDEALANVIRHAYDGRRNGRILISGRQIEEPSGRCCIEVVIRDFGRQVDPATICSRDLDDIRPGGLGVHIIRSVTDVAEYSRAEGGGMQLRLCKRRCDSFSSRSSETKQ